MMLSFKSPVASEKQGQLSWKEPYKEEDQNVMWPTIGWKGLGWEVGS